MAEDMRDDEDLPEDDSTLSAAADKIAALMDEEQNAPLPGTNSGADEGEARQAPVETQMPATAPPPEVQAAMAQAALQAQAAQVQAMAAERDRLAQAYQQLVPQAQAALAGEFPDIRSVEDLERVAKGDPDRYNRFVFAQMRMNQAQSTQRVVQAQQQMAQQAQMVQWRSSEQQKLSEAIPELDQPQVGAALARRLHAFALNNGYTPQDLGNASARDFITLHKAMRLSEIEAAQDSARDKARGAPPVQQPGTRGRSSNGADKFRGDLERLQKSGRVDDAALVFQNLLSH